MTHDRDDKPSAICPKCGWKRYPKDDEIEFIPPTQCPMCRVIYDPVERKQLEQERKKEDFFKQANKKTWLDAFWDGVKHGGLRIASTDRSGRRRKK